MELVEEDCSECQGFGCEACEGRGSFVSSCHFCGDSIPVYPDDVDDENDLDLCTCAICEECGGLMSMIEPGCFECPACKPTPEQLSAAAQRLRASKLRG